MSPIATNQYLGKRTYIPDFYLSGGDTVGKNYKLLPGVLRTKKSSDGRTGYGIFRDGV